MLVPPSCGSLPGNSEDRSSHSLPGNSEDRSNPIFLHTVRGWVGADFRSRVVHTESLAAFAACSATAAIFFFVYLDANFLGWVGGRRFSIPYLPTQRESLAACSATAFAKR